MDEIKAIVQSVLGKLSVKRAPETQEKIQNAWRRIVGKKDAGTTRISGFKDGVLTINIDSPARMYQFNLEKKKILESLQKEEPSVQKIYFTIGKTQ